MIEFLSFILNSVTMTIILTDEKKRQLKSFYTNILLATTTNIRKIASIVGKITSCFPARCIRCIRTDASSYGWGAVIEAKSAGGLLSASEKDWLSANHLPGVWNFEADLESCKQEIHTERKAVESWTFHQI